LTLYGLGTNTGLKRISAGEHGESYKELLGSSLLHVGSLKSNFPFFR
jgi:hypothetical protein